MRAARVILPLLVACSEGLPAPGDGIAGDLSAVDDLAVTADLSVERDLAVPADLSVARLADLSAPFDIAFDPDAFCAGTGASCALTFFTQLAGCYRPAGTCEVNGGLSYDVTCWASGAGLARGGYLRNTVLMYTQDGILCGSSRPLAGDPSMIQWTLADGTTLWWDVATNRALCPDGTIVDMSPYGSCANLTPVGMPCAQSELVPLGSFPCPSFPPYPSASPAPSPWP